MEKFIPYEKLSRKEKKKTDSARRGTWNGISPVTRVADTDRKKYRRKPKYPDKYH